MPWGAELTTRDMSSFHVACEALDLAAAQAHGSIGGHGIAIVKGVSDLAILDYLPAQAAMRGLHGALLWHSPAMAGERPDPVGFAISGPDTRAPWLVRAGFADPSELHGRLHALFDKNSPGSAALDEAARQLGERFGVSSLFTAQESAGDIGTGLRGFVLAIWRPDPVEAFNPHDMLPYPISSAAQGDGFISGAQMAERIERSLTRGELLALTDWHALNTAATSVLVSNEDEATLRPEGVDHQLYL
jgi:hypothetical protein